MSTNPSIDPQKAAAQLFAMLKSVAEFDEIEVRAVVNNLLSPTSREDCFLAIYNRAVANVASLQQLTTKQHFQAISMLARTLFELAVDIWLIDAVPDAIPKMLIFSEVEKLRCAKKIVAFKLAHPTATVDDSIYQSFIASEDKNIQAKKDVLWPGQNRVEHWSGMKLPKRVQLLGPQFDQMYDVEYPRLSWYVHTGLTGIVNIKAETFLAICGVALKSSTDSYEQILLKMISEFKIDKADPKIKDKLKAATLLPFAESKQEAETFFKAVVG